MIVTTDASAVHFRVAYPPGSGVVVAAGRTPDAARDAVVAALQEAGRRSGRVFVVLSHAGATERSRYVHGLAGRGSLVRVFPHLPDDLLVLGPVRAGR